MKAITPEQADRIEKKLDMILEHFSIGEEPMMSPVEIRALARKNHNLWVERQNRKEQNKSASQQGHGWTEIW